MSGIVIQGFSNSDKAPGAVGETIYGASALGAGDIPKKAICVGLKTSAGSLTADGQPREARSYDDCDALAGAGSELADMGYAFIDQGISVWLLATAAGGGAAASAATITITFSAGSVPTSVGALKYRIAGRTYSIGVVTTDSVTTIAVKIKNAILGDARAIVTASNSSGVVTVTYKTATTRGDAMLVYQDTTGAPSNTVSTLGGGGTATNTTGITLTGGAGTEDVTNVLAVMLSGEWTYQAWAVQDSTNVALVEAQIDAKAGYAVGKLEYAWFGFTGSLSSATSIAQTTLNNARCSVPWMLNGESSPARVAAAAAALAMKKESTTPNANFDGDVLVGIAPSQFTSDNPIRATIQSALNNSVTPIQTIDGKALVVRMITSKSLNGSSPDYRTLDRADARVPDFIREDLCLQWTTGFLVANPHVRSDPAAEEPEPPAGVATPARWNSYVTARLLEHQADLIVTQVELNPPESEFNSTAVRIDSAVPVVRLPHQHAIGISVRQKSI